MTEFCKKLIAHQFNQGPHLGMMAGCSNNLELMIIGLPLEQ